MFLTSVDTLMGYCDTCGHYGYLITDSHMCEHCDEAERAFHDSHPAPVTDGDDHMIINHYRGL